MMVTVVTLETIFPWYGGPFLGYGVSLVKLVTIIVPQWRTSIHDHHAARSSVGDDGHDR